MQKYIWKKRVAKYEVNAKDYFTVFFCQGPTGSPGFLLHGQGEIFFLGGGGNILN